MKPKPVLADGLRDAVGAGRAAAKRAWDLVDVLRDTTLPLAHRHPVAYAFDPDYAWRHLPPDPPELPPSTPPAVGDVEIVMAIGMEIGARRSGRRRSPIDDVADQLKRRAEECEAGVRTIERGTTPSPERWRLAKVLAAEAQALAPPRNELAYDLLLEGVHSATVHHKVLGLHYQQLRDAGILPAVRAVTRAGAVRNNFQRFVLHQLTCLGGAMVCARASDHVLALFRWHMPDYLERIAAAADLRGCSTGRARGI